MVWTSHMCPRVYFIKEHLRNQDRIITFGIRMLFIHWYKNKMLLHITLLRLRVTHIKMQFFDPPFPVRLAEFVHQSYHHLRLVQIRHGRVDGWHEVYSVRLELEAIGQLLFAHVLYRLEVRLGHRIQAEEPAWENCIYTNTVFLSLKKFKDF